MLIKFTISGDTVLVVGIERINLPEIAGTKPMPGTVPHRWKHHENFKRTYRTCLLQVLQQRRIPAGNVGPRQLVNRTSLARLNVTLTYGSIVAPVECTVRNGFWIDVMKDL